MCRSEYIEVTIELKKFYGLDTNVTHLADEACVPMYRDEDKVVFMFALDECKTQQVVDDDAIHYKNRVVAIVKDVDEYSDITRANTHLIPFQCTYKKTARISAGQFMPNSLLVVTNTGKINVLIEAPTPLQFTSFHLERAHSFWRTKEFACVHVKQTAVVVPNSGEWPSCPR